MKRIIAILLTIVTLLSMLFTTGCSKKSVKIYTRGEWISALSELFGMEQPYSSDPYFDDVDANNPVFNAVQNCVEWEIIEKGDNFNPNDRADVNFAIETAIKAIGLDRIENSIDGEQLNTSKSCVKYFNKKSNVKYISGSNLYMDTAEQILTDVQKIYLDLVPKKTEDVKYVESVKKTTENEIKFSTDGESAKSSLSVNVGDIIMVEPSSNYPYGKYVKVSQVTDNGFKYEKPQLEEVFDHVIFSGEYKPEILEVIPLIDGVKVTNIGDATVVPQSSTESATGISYVPLTYTDSSVTPLKAINIGDIVTEISCEPKKGLTISGSVGLKNITVDADFEMWGPVVNKAYIGVNSTLEADITFAAEANAVDATIPIAKVPCKLFGAAGISFIFGIKVGIEGSIAVVWSIDTSASVEYKPLRSAKFNAKGENPNLDVELKAKVYAKPDLKAQVELGEWAIGNVGINSGFEASASTKLIGTSDDVGCIDIKAYVPLSIYVGAEKEETLLGKLGIKRSWNIWNSNNSPVKKSWHVEDWQIVDECTKGKEDADIEEDEDNNALQNEDETINEIPPIVDYTGGLTLSSSFAALDEGTRDIIKVVSLPDNYTSNDLIFTSSDSRVVIVDNNGNISAVGSGSCVVKVSTRDGIYSQYCAIKVYADYSVDFTPLNHFIRTENNYVFAA